MKRFILAACAALLATAAPALAADLPVPFKAAPSYAAPFNWTGFYVGINGGYGWAKSSWTDAVAATTTGDFDATGAMVGGTIGYNLQMSQIVVGFEGDIDASWMKGTDSTACCETKNDWFATARGRLGYAMDRFMPFLTARRRLRRPQDDLGARLGDRDQDRLDRRRRRRIRLHGRLVGQARISLRRSRQGLVQRRHLRHRDRRHLQGQYRARRRQLPLLAGSA